MADTSSKLVLYTVAGSPPGFAVRLVLKYLEIPHTLKNVDYFSGEHFGESYLQMYPQGELPVLSDDGLIIGESIAIMQYLAEKYGRNETFYPKCPTARSVINHRLAFTLSTYQRRVYDYVILPLDYAYEKTDDNLKKLQHALKILDEFLKRTGGLYAAGENFTIADPLLIMDTVALEALDVDLSPYTNIVKWYKNFQTAHPDLWILAQEARNDIIQYTKNPLDMSAINHPIHPTKPN